MVARNIVLAALLGLALLGFTAVVQETLGPFERSCVPNQWQGLGGCGWDGASN